MRAMSRRTVCSRLLLSSWPVAFWKRRLNSSSLASFSRVTSSSSATSRSSVACLFGPLLTLPTSLALAGRVRGTLCSPIRSQARSSDVTHFALHDPALHRELVDRTPQRLTGDRLVRVGELEEQTTRLHVGDPPLRRTLTGTHAGLGRLLRQRTVRVDVDPHLAATLDVPGHRDTSRLDLAVRHVRRLQRLDAEFAERDPGAALGGPVTIRVVLLAVLDPARDQHGSALLSCGLAVVTRRGTGRARTAGPGRTLAALLADDGLGGLALGAALHDVTLVDPHLDADPAEGGAGLVDAVVDVRPEGVQRHPALAVELRPAHLGTAEASGALHPDALDARALHRRLHRLAHGATERHPAGELLGNPLRDELSIGLGVLHLEDVQLHLLAGELLQLTADAVGLCAAAADDDARPGGVDVDADPVAGALDLDLGDARALHALGHHPPNGHVFLDVVLVELVRIPAGLPLGGDAETEPVRVYLLTHYSALPFADFSDFSAAALLFAGAAGAFLAAFFAGADFSAFGPDFAVPAVAGAAFFAAFLAGFGFAATLSTTTVMWLVRFRTRYARPKPRGRNRFMVGPSSTNAWATRSVSGSSRSLFSAFATALASTLYTGSLADCGANCSTVRASPAGRPRMRSTTRRAF